MGAGYLHGQLSSIFFHREIDMERELEIKCQDCGNMVGHKVDTEEVIEYKCKIYGGKPPCHLRVGHPGWVDQMTCKDWISVKED